MAITDVTLDAAIYYTTNGSKPTSSSTPYTGPINVSATQAINAVAVSAGYLPSAVASVTYTINVPQLPLPSFSVSGGPYNSPQTVAIFDSNAQAAIYYTSNGSTPTTGSSLYTGPIAVSATETLKAMAVASGYTNSALASASYTINLPVLPAPVFSIASGTYTTIQTVGMSESNAQAVVYYTTNGSTPTARSMLYSGPITVSTTETIKAIAVATGYTNSAVTSATYTMSLPTATPTFSVPGGTYTTVQTVSIADTTPNAMIYYTTNGGNPTVNSAQYTVPISVNSSETLRAMAVASGYTNSAVATASYVINLQGLPTPTLSVAGGTYTTAQTVAIADLNAQAVIYYTMDGSMPTTSSAVYSAPITVSASKTINAIASAQGYGNSFVASASYVINPVAATPVFTVPGGTYNLVQTVGITDGTASSAIHYTINGSTPTAASALYTGPITVSSTETLKAIAVASGYTNSAVASASYIVNASPLPAPVFSLGGGTYNTVQTVAISDANAQTSIYYTTYGSTPTSSSLIYNGPVSVVGSGTLRAIAIASGYPNSAVASATYTIMLPAATPAFSVQGGTYTSVQTAAITDATSGASIYYTTNGNTPTASSTLYTGPITVSKTVTLRAIAVAPGYSNSASATYTINLPGLPTPTFSVAGGKYSAAQLVTIADGNAQATFYYTTDGSTPTRSSTLYKTPILIDATKNLKAIASAPAYGNSYVASAAYVIQP